MWAYEKRIAWPYSWQLLAGLCARCQAPVKRWELPASAIGPKAKSHPGGPGQIIDPKSRGPCIATPPSNSPTTDVANKRLRSCNLDSFLRNPHAHQRITIPFFHRQTEYRFGMTQQSNPGFQPPQPPVNNLSRTLKWRKRWSIANRPPDLVTRTASRPSRPSRPRDIKANFPP